jgi:predicted RNA binding protein YcfA (HicA-like mRNA interferase family)
LREGEELVSLREGRDARRSRYAGSTHSLTPITDWPLMPKEVTVKALTVWLRRNGFNELTGKKTGHRFFEKNHVKITLPGHGPNDLTKKHVGMILRQLEHMGYDRDAVRDEL